METEKLIYAMLKFPCIVLYESKKEDTVFLDQNFDTVLSVNREVEFCLNTDFEPFKALDETQKQQIMKYVLAYVSTPVAMRG